MLERVKYCDILRVIAIICVILIHIFAGFRDYYLQNNYNIYVFLTFLDSLTRIGVPIFFMISGVFMLSNTKKISYKEFIKKNIIIKLVIPFIVISFLYYLYTCIINHNPISILEFIRQFSNNQIKYHFWFMYKIILIYLLIPFLKVLISKINRKDLLNLIIIIFLFGNVLYTINLYSKRYDFTLFSSILLPELIIYINYLLLGYYLFKYNIKINNRKIIYIIGIICIFIMPLADSLFINGTRYDEILSPRAAFSLLPSAAFFIYFKYNYNTFKIPFELENFISKNISLIFYIYMLHVIVMEIVERIIIKFYLPINFLGSCLLFINIFIFTLIISYAISYIIYKGYNLIINLLKK